MFEERSRISALTMVLLLLSSALFSIAGSTVVGEGGGPDAPKSEYAVRTLWGDVMIDDLMTEIPSLPEDLDSDIYVVQFAGPILTEWRKDLDRRGVGILGYLPDMCYVVRSETLGVPDLLGIEGVTGVSHFPSGLKISPWLYEQLGSPPGTQEIVGSDQLMVDLFFPDPSIGSKLLRIAPVIEKGSETRYVVDLPVSSVDEILGIPSVSWVEPRLTMELHNNVSKDIIGVQTIWDTLGLNGSGQKVAIADTGIDTGVDSHSVDGDMIADFDNRVTTSTWAGPDSSDTHSHGTHVTGSVAGNGSNSNGSIQGMAPEAEIFFQSIANQNAGNRLELPSNLSLLFQDAYDFGARIHTNSWGAAYAGAYTTSSRDVDWFLYYHPEMIILFSAGNNGMDYYKPYGTYNPDGKIDPDSIGSPATAKNCITVGAGENYRLEGGYQFQWGTGSWLWKYSMDPIRTDLMSDDPTGIAAFSSRGPTDDGRMKPDVIAPGTNILSVRSTRTSATGWGTFAHNSNYLFMGGTSMSTPITAGTMVLIREFYEEVLNHTAPSGALMKATLVNGAQDMTPGQYGSDNATIQEIISRPDDAQGWGRIDIPNSLVPRRGATVSYIDEKVGIRTDDVVTRYVNVNSTDDLRLTLAWSDYPAAAYASVTLVNDLDLVLTAPNGTIYHGNDFLSPFNDTTDRTNPLEGISVPSPALGWWKVEVKAYNTPMGPQHFGLAANYELIETSGALELETYRNYVSTSRDNVTVSIFNPLQTSQSTVNVHIKSTSDQTGKNIALQKVGTFGQFTGYFITSNTSTSAPDELQVAHDDVINVTYTYSSTSLFSEMTAKDPVRIVVYRTPELGLVQSEHEMLHLKGAVQPGVRSFWMFEGLQASWMPFFDDGLNSSGDMLPDDGNVSALWSVPNQTFGSRNLLTLVEDPFLGPLVYEQFNVTFNTSVPRFPKNLTGSTLQVGNTVTLNWDPSNETDLSHYSVFTNLSGSMAPFDRWINVGNTSGVATNITVGNLTDGLQYWFRVSAVDLGGNSSSMSVPFNVTPTDTEPPIIDLITTPFTIVGVARLQFMGSPDLAMAELQYYNDSNRNGIEDDGVWMDAGIGYPGNFTWDTRNESGGPGNIDRMFLRYRGYDEVPNISDWVTAYGFRIDNTGPASVELLNPPPRVTNTGSYSLIGKSEAMGWVWVWKNGSAYLNATVDDLGAFSFDLELSEGANNITLAAYDQYGAGPTLRTYFFTFDTMLPVPMFDVENQTHIFREIRYEPYTFNSTSYDTGLDSNFTYIENITWTYTGPDGIPEIHYGDDHFTIGFVELGDHFLAITVRDPAGNSNGTTLRITVFDGSPPVISVDGPSSVNEKSLISYELNWTDNDPRAHLRDNFSIGWSFTGPDGFLENFTTALVRIVFPGPGSYALRVFITDGENNSAETGLNITVSDITPPDGNILGNTDVILGIPETYTANMTDNSGSMGPGSTYSWKLQYVDGPPDLWWTKNFTGISFEYNFTDKGLYILELSASDPSGNERVIKVNIDADGDLTPPHVAEVLPAPNATFQFSENIHFIIRFSERINQSTLTSDSVYLRSQNGSIIPSTLSIAVKEGRTEVLLSTDTLEFETNYTLVVEPVVKDTWNNHLQDRFSVTYTIRTLFRLVFPWGPSHSDYFANFTNSSAIILRFSNPVAAATISNYLAIRALTTEVDIFTGRERQVRTPVPFVVKQGEDEFSVIVEALMDEGVTYNFTLSKGALDIYNYELDQDYMWNFQTYLPPVTQQGDDDDDDDDGPLPEFLKNPLWWIIAAVAVVLLLVILMILGMIRRRKNLDKIWEADQGGPQRRARQPETVPEPIPEMEESGVEAPSEPQVVSYEDLYGSFAPPKEVGEAPAPPPEPPVSPFLDYASEPPPQKKEIDWDEDEAEGDEEDWDEEDEEDWEDDEEEDEEEELEW
ncbi:MAG: S8 family serine peptidase [Thermoplasmatota archaeon]